MSPFIVLALPYLSLLYRFSLGQTFPFKNILSQNHTEMCLDLHVHVIEQMGLPKMGPV
jgi:hypothetical protein